MPKVLIIEDDKVLSGLIREYLTEKKFEADAVHDGAEGLEWLSSQEYGAAIIDIDLPSMTGLDVCKQYRGQGGQTPIIMLTKRAEVSDKVVGLQLGADDYLPKPFHLDELYARLIALMRRPAAIKSTTITVGQLSLDTFKRVALVKGQKLDLSRKELALLELLASNPERPFSGEAIIDKLWGTESESTVWAIRTHITRIRSKIAAIDKETAELIKTVYGAGYKLELPTAKQDG